MPRIGMVVRWGVAALIASVGLGPGARPAPAAVVTVKAMADTYVSASSPRTQLGKRSVLVVGRAPTRRAYLRFRIPAGRIERVTLRVFSLRPRPRGFEARRVSAGGWSERHTTFRSRPRPRGAIARSGPLGRRRWTAVDVTALVGQRHRAALVLTASGRRAVKVASREHRRKAPRLIVRMASSAVAPTAGSPPAAVGPDLAAAPASRLAQIAGPTEGSSDPTYFSSNHRIAMTAAGRELVVYGRHAQGVQLGWRDPGGGWRTATRGATATGTLLAATGTGDWPASIAVARDSAGAEHAWVVWGRASPASAGGAARPVQLVRLSDLDSPSGPIVAEPETADEGASGGALRPDIGFEHEDGGARGVLTWTHGVGDGTFQVVAGWFSLDSDDPSVESVAVLETAPNSLRGGTVVEAPGGARIVARAGTNDLTVFAHAQGVPETQWQAHAGAVMQGGPTAAVLDAGALLAAGESNATANVVSVQRFADDGTPGRVELSVAGYREPTIATDGERAWLVMVRVSDGFVVSREFTPANGWGSDRIEIGAEGGGSLGYPNALRRTDGRLRFVVRGPSGGGRAAVLAYTRPL